MDIFRNFPLTLVADQLRSGQLAGGENSAYEIAIGQRDRSYRFANSAMWLDNKAGLEQGDFYFQSSVSIMRMLELPR